VGLVTVGSYVVSVALELQERYGRWLGRYEHWELDELPLALSVLACGLAWYAMRRRREALAELAHREQAEAHLTTLFAHNRELAQGLIALQERERRALARELHDEFAQRCAALRAETAWLRRAAAEHAGIQAAAQRADGAAQDLSLLVRDLLRRLRSADLDTLGLVAALQAQCEAWEERTGVCCTFHHEGLAEPLGETVDVTVYRVAQEALTNVMRHARAAQVRVRLVRGPGELRLTVQDDGRGMEAADASRGLGLLGAAERAAAAGGELSVHGPLGQGVLLTLRIPLPAATPWPRQAVVA
jgi:signal transduction histidine kinase